jgi:uncharacterized membrane protein
MDSFLYTLNDIINIFGHLLSAIGFFMVGLGLGRFLLDFYPKANWQMQMALTLGFFGLLIALTVFASAGSAGAFALGAGVAFFSAKKEKGDADATVVEEVTKKK